MTDAIQRFIKSADFYKSLTFIIAALIPVLLYEYYLNKPEIGFAIALGVFFNSFTNSPGSVKHRTVGMLVSIGLTSLATLITGYVASVHKGWLLPVLGLLTFFISYLAVYGFRASMVSFAAMLAVAFSISNSYADLTVFEYTCYVFIGGVWYLLVSSLANRLNPKMYIEELLSDTLELTGKYIETRAKLLTQSSERNTLQADLYEYQAVLSDKHETLREIIISQRQESGFSNRIRRKLLLFIELVDMLELAVANPLNYEQVDQVFEKSTEIITPFTALIQAMATRLSYFSRVVIRDEKVRPNSEIRDLLKEVRNALDRYQQKVGKAKENEGFYILVNLFEYQVTQAQKLDAIERELNTLTKNNSLKATKNIDERFLSPQDYGFSKFKENFSLKSSLFRHALRLSISMVIGFGMGTLFSFQNPYWILITLLVIMRPSYGLTKQRMKHRVMGTLVGAAIAVITVVLVHNTLVFGVLAALSITLALAMVQLNYKAFAAFITLHIVFMYAIYHPDVLYAVQYRVLDTLLGATLAMVANLFLFPSWEFMAIDDSLQKVLIANMGYLNRIEEKYRTKDPKETNYKLSRKKAFLAVGDLNAAFQRMTQEPKSRQKFYAEIYDIVVLQNTFLATLASLGTFIRTHETTAMSNAVAAFFEHILHNLKNANQVLSGTTETYKHREEEINSARIDLENKFQELSIHYEKISMSSTETQQTKKRLALELREVKLILEQLSYLFSLSEHLIQKTKVYRKQPKDAASLRGEVA